MDHEDVPGHSYRTCSEEGTREQGLGSCCRSIEDTEERQFFPGFSLCSRRLCGVPSFLLNYQVIWLHVPIDQAHRRQWSAAEFPSGAAPC